MSINRVTSPRASRSNNMPGGRVRFFSSTAENGEPSTVIGYSQSLGLQTDLLRDNFSEEQLFDGYTFNSIEAPQHLAHLACEFIEVVPPLDERQIRRLASLSLRYADTGRNSVSVIDNREIIPERVLQNAGPIINWI